MTGLVPLVLASLAVAGLVALCWVLGFRGNPELDGEAEAIALAQSLQGGVVPITVLLAQDKRHALLVDQSGRQVLITPHGSHFVAVPVSGAIFACVDAEMLELGFGRRLVRIRVGPSRQVWLDLLHRARSTV